MLQNFTKHLCGIEVYFYVFGKDLYHVDIFSVISGVVTRLSDENLIDHDPSHSDLVLVADQAKPIQKTIFIKNELVDFEDGEYMTRFILIE